eukprot:m.66033 g.66033  ORF g.66033 m.66033 type:complete len:691 (+) comp8176_c0_seq1:52-2124(+)
MESIRESFERINVTLISDEVALRCCDLCKQYGLKEDQFVSRYDAFTMRHNQSNNPTLQGLTQFASELHHEMQQRGSSTKKNPQTPKSHSHQSHNFITSKSPPGMARNLAGELVQAFGVDEKVAEAMKESAKKKMTSKRRTGGGVGTLSKRGVGGLGADVDDLVEDFTPPSSRRTTLSPLKSPATASGRTGSVTIDKKKIYSGITLTEDQELGMNMTSLDITVTEVEGQLTSPYKYMFEKLLDRANSLDSRVEFMSERILKSNKKDIAARMGESGDATITTATSTNNTNKTSTDELDFSDVGMATQGTALYAGKVYLNSTAGLRKTHSLELEGSIETSAGARVPLQLTPDVQCSLFSGQTVIVEGTNPTGTVLTAKKIYTNGSAPHKKTNAMQLKSIYYGSDDSITRSDLVGVKFMVVSGPYSVVSADGDMLDYALLDEFLNQVNTYKPDVVIMQGPFVDENSPLVKTSSLPQSFEEEFNDVMEKVGMCAVENSNTQFVIIPSLSDVTHDPIFPQAPFTIPPNLSEDMKKRIHFLPNPALFLINELVIATTSLDSLFDLNKSSVFFEPKDDKKRKKLDLLVHHILEQRSFYPVDPPSEHVQLDFENLKYIEMEARPDILIMPSKLNIQTQGVDRTVFVNPHTLARSGSKGRYVEMVVVAPSYNSMLERGDSAMFIANAAERTTCKVVEISL